MAEVVVHVFEPVQVDQSDGDGGPGAAVGIQHFGEVAVQGSTVGQGGQLIVGGLEAELFVQGHPCVDVPLHADEVGDLAVVVQ